MSADTPHPLAAKWEEAERTGKRVSVGAIVVCDVCNEDYTARTESGGFIFGSYAYCPACAVKHLPVMRRYGEEHHIHARCPATQSFADFVRELRGPDAYVSITSFGGDA